MTTTKKQHDLKCWPEFFELAWQGLKHFEIRLNDRDYQVGDTLVLREWSKTTQSYTGRRVRRKITYLYEGEMTAPGYCVLSVKKLPDIGY